MTWYSQAGQDRWVCEQLDFRRDGFFVDVGAYDGIQTSNTYMLEQELDWVGVCIEASPYFFMSLFENRPRAQNIHMAITDHRGHVQFAGDSIVASGGVEVPCDTLTNILEVAGAPRVIDYMSVDIEGAELDALSAFDFERYEVQLLTVEHNLYRDGPELKDALFELLVDRGFVRAVEDAGCLGPCPPPAFIGCPFEDWYVRR